MAVKMDPIHQFELKPIFTLGRIGNTEIVFTNAALYMLVAVVVIALLTTMATRRGSLVPGRIQFLVEMLYEFIASTVRSSAGRIRRECATVTEWSGPSSSRFQKSRKSRRTGNLGARS